MMSPDGLDRREPEAEPRRRGRTSGHTRRLSDKLLLAFHQACDQADFEVAERLLHVLEMMLRRRPPRLGERRGRTRTPWWQRTSGSGNCGIRTGKCVDAKEVRVVTRRMPSPCELHHPLLLALALHRLAVAHGDDAGRAVVVGRLAPLSRYA